MDMGDHQESILTITAKDKAGNPTDVQPGSVVLAPSDPTILTTTSGADELHPIVRALGPLGTAHITVTADADLGAGVETISADTEDYVIKAEKAVGLGLVAGTPTEIV